MIPTKFTYEEAEAAYEEWGMNCGPAALAAIYGLRPEQVRLAIPDFEVKRYTSPSMMYAALRALGKDFRTIYTGIEKNPGRERWPEYGLARIQFEGPWCNPGVPMAARYRYTHWVGAEAAPHGIGIFDVNCLNNGSGWVSKEDWSDEIMPYLTENIKRATGAWHITHSIEVTA